MESLIIENFTVEAAGREVVRNVSMRILPGEIHALVGPNGSGKSSLAYALFGHPEYRVTRGSARLGAIDLLALAPEERARAGMFLSFQEPPEIGGVSVRTFLGAIAADTSRALRASEEMKLGDSFLSRFLNEGFSGGEKKKSEILQLAARRHKFAILDELDTGLDADSVAQVLSLIRDLTSDGMGVLAITHSQKFLAELSSHTIHVIYEGAIVSSGGREISSTLQENGYRSFVPRDKKI